MLVKWYKITGIVLPHSMFKKFNTSNYICLFTCI